MKPRRDEAIEPGRLRRAITRKWEHLGDRVYMVEGRHEPFYFVDLDADVPCFCADAFYHGPWCVHVLRCLIIEQHPAVWQRVLELAAKTIEREEQGVRHCQPRRPARGVRTEAASRPAGTPAVESAAPRERRPARRRTVAV